MNFMYSFLLALTLPAAVSNMVLAPSTSNGCGCEKGGLPCYPYLLTVVFDGSFGWLYDKESFVEHQQKAGRSAEEAIKKGKTTAAWFKERFGVDFTNLPDEAYLDSTGIKHSVKDGNGGEVIFYNYLLNPSGRYRLVSASMGDQARFFNSAVSNGGWAIKVLSDFAATGTYGNTLNAGAQISRGDYAIDFCGEKSDIFGGRTAISIEYECNSFVPPNGNVIIDCTVSNDLLGKGTARGALFPAPDVEKSFKYDGRNVLAFPGTLP